MEKESAAGMYCRVVQKAQAPHLIVYHGLLPHKPELAELKKGKTFYGNCLE